MEQTPKFEVGDLVGIQGLPGVFRIEEITTDSPFRYRVLFMLGFFDEEDLISLGIKGDSGFSNNPVKLRITEKSEFSVGDRVKFIGTNIIGGAARFGLIGEIIDIDPRTKSCFVLYPKTQHWEDPCNIAHVNHQQNNHPQ